MLKFYYNRISVNTRRVWVALLEKQLTFEPVTINVNGDHLRPEFLAVNPFHRIPVLEDDGFKVIESLAILDYLEAKYPMPPLLPTEARDLAIVRMAELVALNELLPATLPLMRQMLAVAVEAKKVEQALKKTETVLQFFEENLAAGGPYFIGRQLTLADIVAGTAVELLPLFGVPLDNYPLVKEWCDRLASRESWQKTMPSPEEIEAAKPGIKAILERQE